MGRITHELLGQLHKAHKGWTPGIVPASLMRELVIAVEDGTITGRFLPAMHIYTISHGLRLYG